MAAVPRVSGSPPLEREKETDYSRDEKGGAEEVEF